MKDDGILMDGLLESTWESIPNEMLKIISNMKENVTEMKTVQMDGLIVLRENEIHKTTTIYTWCGQLNLTVKKQNFIL